MMEDCRVISKKKKKKAVMGQLRKEKEGTDCRERIWQYKNQYMRQRQLFLVLENVHSTMNQNSDKAEYCTQAKQ